MTEQRPLNIAQLPLRLRVEDVLLLDGAGAFARYRKTELIDGELFFMNAQHRPHLFAKDELAFQIRLALQAFGSDLFVATEGSVHLSDYDLPEPDILLTNAPRGEGPVPGSSIALLVEVSDATLTFDTRRKMPTYARAGVSEFWIVDVRACVVHQHWAAQGGSYGERRTTPFGEPVTAATIAGLTVPTASL